MVEKTLDRELPPQSDKTKVSELPVTPRSKTYLMESIRKLLERQDLSLRTVDIKDATLIIVQPRSNSLPARKIPILVSTQLELTRPNPNQVNVDGKLSNVEIGGLSFRGTLKAKDLLSEQIPINIDLESTALPIIKANTLAEKLTGLETISVKFKSGQIQNIFIHLQGLINPNKDPFKEIIMTSGFEARDLEILIFENGRNKRITLPYLDGEGVWQKSILSYEVNGVLWDGSIQSSFVINLPDALEGSFIGTINAEARLEGLNLTSAEFNFPDKWQLIAGTAKGSIKLQGPIGEPSFTLRKYGELHISDLTLGLETPITVSQTMLNLQQKSSQQTLARVQIKDALFNNVSIKTADANLKFFPEKIALTNGRLIPSNGVILFSGDYHPQLKTYIIRINGKKIHIEDILTEQMKGSGLFKGMFQGNLNTAQKIQQKGETLLFSHIASGLSGRRSIELKDGGISASPVIDKLSTLLNSVSAVTPQKQGLNFNTLGGDLKIWEGKIVTENFELKGPQMNLAVLVAANLVTGKLGGEIKLVPMQLLESITGAIPILGNLLKKDVTDLMAEPYFSLGGTLEKPEFILEEGKTLFGKPANVLEELVNTPR